MVKTPVAVSELRLYAAQPEGGLATPAMNRPASRRRPRPAPLLILGVSDSLPGGASTSWRISYSDDEASRYSSLR